MAIVHEERHGDRTYQVRTAGASVRLYTNGVFHSQYSPSPRAATSIWDLLLVPALLAPGGRPRNVLVLGVGGGAVLRRLSELFEAPRITGVELDPVHIDIGRRFFGLDQPNIELVAADARTWLARNRRRRYDLVIDDLFVEHAGQPARAIPFDRPWLDALSATLLPGGAIGANFAELAEFSSSAMSRVGRGEGRWPSGYSLRLATLMNVVAGIGGYPVAMPDLVEAIHRVFGRRIAEDISIRRFPRQRRQGTPGRR